MAAHPGRPHCAAFEAHLARDFSITGVGDTVLENPTPSQE
jgi:hypothetical protein